MLRELTIENFALIDKLSLTTGKGFSVLTGETGAGKSIIIDALNAVLGERVGADAIRGGETKARIEAVFDVSDIPAAVEAMRETGLADEGDTTLILSREIASGRSAYRVNNRASTLSALQQVGRHLVDIHGQHEHQTLIHEESHLSFLDSFGGAAHLELLGRYEEEFSAFQEALRALEDLQMDERERVQRVDMLQFQVKEIEQAGLQPDEEETLGSERSRLKYSETIREALGRAGELLDGEGEEAVSALAAVQTAGRELAAAAEKDPELAPVAGDLETAAVLIDEAGRSLRDYLAGLNSDPQRLEQIERRLADIAALKRKYGDTIPEILAFWERAAAQLKQFSNVETREQELRAQLAHRRETAGKLAEELSQARQEISARLSEAAQTELAGLGMADPRLEVQLEREASEDGLPCSDGGLYRARRRGIDICRFLFSANLGEATRPLSKIASGGELSRLMLVLKSVCSQGDNPRTLVFDEVDAGIGGRVAHAVGERIVGLSEDSQVLCVTHLAQIARLADTQICVTKVIEDGRTTIRARRLNEEERIAELARMMGGDDDDQTARKHASELLAEAQRDRARIRDGARPV